MPSYSKNDVFLVRYPFTNVPSVVKRGIYTVHPNLVVKRIGRLSTRDAQQLEQSLREWLGL
ncbi:MAG: hypothetical protein MAG431_02400 [Chloroflexi bacterium]|nr:hypothetical protein [Chloroflexota bacterium]